MKKYKIYNLLLFVLMFLCISSIIILRPLNNLDELWNYNFAKNMANGLIAYKDFNMLLMPLLPMICGVILKIFSNQLILMRIMAGLLCSAMLFTVYKILITIKFLVKNKYYIMKKEVAIIFVFGIGYLFRELFCIDYNFATLLVVLIIVLYEIKYYQKDNNFIKYNAKEDIFLGVLAGLTVTLKQTSGLLICIALLGNRLLFVRNKEELIAYLKKFAYRLIGILIPVVLILIYIIYNNAFSDFISYTIFGISEFKNYISYKTLVRWNVVGVLSILVPFVWLYEWYKTVIKEKDKQKYILLVYGLAIFVIAFPISNDIHFLIAATPTIILILCEIYNLLYRLYKKIYKTKKIIMAVTYFSFIFIILYTAFFTFKNFKKYIDSKNQFSNLNSYSFIINNEGDENLIKNIDEYLVNNADKKILILDASAAVYKIPINQYNKDYDLFLKGNLGKNGEARIISEIEKAENTKYLILKDKYNKNWQTPLNVIDYVKNNKSKTDEIEIFDVYE